MNPRHRHPLLALAAFGALSCQPTDQMSQRRESALPGAEAPSPALSEPVRAASAALGAARGAAQATGWPCEGEPMCALFEQGCTYDEGAHETMRCAPPASWCARDATSLAPASIPASWTFEALSDALSRADSSCPDARPGRWGEPLKVEGLGALLLFTEPGAQRIWLHRAGERGAGLMLLHTFHLRDDIGLDQTGWSLGLVEPLKVVSGSTLRRFTYRLSRETTHGTFLRGEPACCDKLTSELDVVMLLEGDEPLLHASTRYQEEVQDVEDEAAGRVKRTIYCDVDVALTADKRLKMKRSVKRRDKRMRAEVTRETRALADGYERQDWCVEAKD